MPLNNYNNYYYYYYYYYYYQISLLPQRPARATTPRSAVFPTHYPNQHDQPSKLRPLPRLSWHAPLLHLPYHG